MRITDPETFRRQVLGRLLVNHPERVPLDLLQIMVAAAALPDVARASYTMLRTVTTLRGWRRNLMLREDILHPEAPTLFLWGDADAFAPPSRGQDIVARMPNAGIEVLPNTGHLPYVDRPDAVAGAIIRFLGHSRPAAAQRGT